MTQAAFAVFAMAVRSASQFLLGVLVANSLDPSGFGIFVLATAFLAIGMPIASLGLGSASLILGSAISRNGEGQSTQFSSFRRQVSSAGMSSAALGLATAVVMVVVFRLFYQPDPSNLVFVVGILSTLVILGPLEILLFAVQGLRTPIPKLTVLHLWIPACRFGFAYLAFTAGVGPASLAIAFVSSVVSGLFICALLVRRSEPLLLENPLRGGAPSLSELMPMLRIGLPATAVTLLVVVQQHGDNMLLRLLVDEHHAGIYGLALRIGLLMGLFVVALSNFVNPQISRLLHRGSAPQLQRLLSGTVGIYGLMLFPVWTGVVIFSEMLVETLVGPAYLGAVGPLRVIAAAVLLSSCVNAYAWTILSSSYRRLDLLCLLGAIAVAVVGNVVLDPHYGAMGAAVANLSGTVVLLVARLAVVRTVIGIPLLESVLLILVILLGMAAILVLIQFELTLAARVGVAAGIGFACGCGLLLVGQTMRAILRRLLWSDSGHSAT